MANANMQPVLRHLRLALVRERAGQSSDRQLLDQYRSQRNEPAFEALLRRHGPLVLGVCRRLLGHEQDAEDVFQATFLVLASNPGAIREGTSVGSWLYGVANRLALKARRSAARRRRHERAKGTVPGTSPTGEADWREVIHVLDEELGGMPETVRAPLLMCYLAGWTQEEAARQLGWSFGTFRRRLERGRESLRRRLVRRGLAPSAGLWAAISAPGSSAAPTLVSATVRAAGLLAPGGPGLPGAVSPQVMTLTQKG
jgi:RNA polymerase sigma factor (sigma-70 family)